ncbi:hypothetical protein TPHA_0O01580 [Tetrapisispora phaffii CBS 4417]|uniref:Shr3 amino acid permease chaperone n=1 Tax=Tetrapisispora phaffii (strain ATCC 24235 / CBS 4417 / NBRC 1672 / NRRL Y-8282 / UCD 70-5) TaxID=1071381 RepID=G8C1U7_TETPH|nr:hypothetical protein TPHA_0O01580 [Tetrapisispora phaffii CBS 4417]CCE66125.1 hypothetical protein TPHA_0O01580 [Tetrapisispora phaffii CBS 4417]
MAFLGLSYEEFCTIGTGLILVSSSFLMGVIFGNQPYDYNVLFKTNSTTEDFAASLNHYQQIYNTNPKVFYVLMGVATLGFIGSMIRIYKPNPELQLFEYTSLGLFVFAICIFITNIKTGVECTISHQWGEVTENQGLAVLASSNIIFLFFLGGTVVLQAGLWYTNWEYQKRLKAFFAEEAAERAAAVEKEATAGQGKGKKAQKENKKQK